MDNKRLIPVMIFCLALMVGWVMLQGYLHQRYPQLREQQGAGPATVETAGTPTASSASQPAGVAASTQSIAPGLLEGISARGEESPRTVLLGSAVADDPTYATGLLLTTRGAGVESVTLNRFKQQVDSEARYTYQIPFGGAVDASRAVASRFITIQGTTVDLSAVNWKLESSTKSTAVFTVDIMSGGVGLLRVTKLYTLPEVSDPSGGYDVKVEHTLTNLTQSPVSVNLTVNGTLTPPWEIERGPERNIFHAYLAEANRQVYIRHTAIESFTASNPTIDLTRYNGNPEPLTWFGTSGAYFNALVRSEPKNLGRVDAHLLNPTQARVNLHEVVTRLEFAPQTVAGGSSVSIPLQVYFGPKKRSVLEQPYYSGYPVEYDQTLVVTFWLCAICTWQWLISLLVMLLNFFHAIVRDWGLAIIVLTMCVRGLLHPVTRKAQANMYKMQKLAPQLERIKTKYKDDKEGMQRAMMEFYKQQGATPIMGCLPMLLQTPIWIALYAGLQSTFELRHQPFLYGLTWIKDLAKPDHLVTFQQSFDLFGMIHVSGINLIPFLLAVVFFLQFKLQPKPPVQTDEQIQQQKIMQWMTLLFPVFLYAAPAGLNIYILASTTFGIIESKLIRDALRRHDEANPNVENVIDVVSPTPAYSPKSRKEQPKGFMARMAAKLEEVQRQAEEVRRQQERKKK